MGRNREKFIIKQERAVHFGKKCTAFYICYYFKRGNVKEKILSATKAMEPIKGAFPLN